MYKQPDLKDYQDDWIQAERDLAINSMGILGLLPIVQEGFIPNESINEPVSKQHEDEDYFTKGDFTKALKGVNRRIGKPKSSPKPS